MVPHFFLVAMVFLLRKQSQVPKYKKFNICIIGSAMMELATGSSRITHQETTSRRELVDKKFHCAVFFL